MTTNQGLYELFKKLYVKINAQLGAPVEIPEECNVFETLDEVIADARHAANGRVTYLNLRPPGEVTLPLEPLLWRRLIQHLFDNARAAGANSICLSHYISDGHLWIKVTDNGWGFPRSVRQRLIRGERLGRGLTFTTQLLRELGGGLQIGSAKTGAELILRVPIATRAASASLGSQHT